MSEPLSGKGLVVFFSALGHTRKLAEAIARETGYDIEAIREPRVPHAPPRGLSGWLGFVRLVRDAARQRPLHLLPLERDPARYPVVVVGTPVWGGIPAGPTRAFLQAYGAHLPPAAFFWTGGSATNPNVVPAMTAASGREPLASASASASQVTRGEFVEQVQALARALAALRQP